MSGDDDLTAATDPVLAPEDHSGVSRRAVLRTAATAGAAATALAATSMPALAATAGRDSAARDRAETAAHHESGGEPIVAHLRNARTGEVDVFHGTSQTRLHDHALAAALIRASK
jgi:hypothetical protein